MSKGRRWIWGHLKSISSLFVSESTLTSGKCPTLQSKNTASMVWRTCSRDSLPTLWRPVICLHCCRFYLHQGGYVFSWICQFFRRITEKQLTWYSWNLVECRSMGQWRNSPFLVKDLNRFNCCNWILRKPIPFCEKHLATEYLHMSRPNWSRTSNKRFWQINS